MLTLLLLLLLLLLLCCTCRIAAGEWLCLRTPELCAGAGALLRGFQQQQGEQCLPC
jgi:hypothetical protein